MSKPDNPSKPDTGFGMKLVVYGGKIGCLTVVSIIVALLLGLWADQQFNTAPWLTLAFLIGSVPVTMILMVRVAKASAAQMATLPSQEKETIQEDVEIGNHS